ncbi:plastidial pyruvate kinase 4, chloroplastic [Canna indica]|uniref:pyruvate kinase n=1 Tax=Canna indica TaxID=4628 RepID=A0AAQ3KNP6_9LILI|nr:plastidial pyruvate kinase 4, chloroplastic [Canna indica]
METLHHSVLTCPRSARGYFNSSSNVTFGSQGSKLQRSTKSNLKYPILFAKLQESDSFESKSGKSYQDSLDANIQKCGRNFSIQESSKRQNQSDLNEEEGSNALSLSSKNFCEYSLNYDVWLGKLQAIYLHVLAAEHWNASRLDKCNRTYLESATNLIHYLAVNSLDANELNEDLYSAGLLNLEHAKFHVLASITSGIRLLENLQTNLSDKNQKTCPLVITDHDNAQGNKNSTDFSISSMKKRASINIAALFGPAQDEKTVNIMVTVGREAIENETLLPELVKAGANVVRINCAHDDPTIWSEIIRLAKHSSQMLEKPCRILMDLAGPKLRTGPMNPGPPVMKLSPRKDAKGDVVFPAQVWLSCPGCGPPTPSAVDATLFVERERFLKEIEIGTVLKFVDSRGKRRSLKVSTRLSTLSGYGFIAECSRTSYVGAGTKLCIEGKKGKSFTGEVVNVPTKDQFIRVRVGDLLTIIREPNLSTIGSNAYDAARITCNSARLFDSVKPGDPIAFDDGRIWGVVQGTSIHEIVVMITRASPKGSKLGSEKSINIPKSEIHFEGLTSKDLVDLEFVAANADMVGISFIRDVHDMEIVLQELKNRKLKDLGIVLKIETHSGFDSLPLLLLQAMQSPNPLGVMIARGDLAVECGWDRMASIQDEILSICNAAHVPVIWATQVLHSLTKKGIPTRSEITDVASGMRASCIMLNKGKYIVEAVSTLKTMLDNRSTVKTMKNLMKPLFPTS